MKASGRPYATRLLQPVAVASPAIGYINTEFAVFDALLTVCGKRLQLLRRF